MNTKRPLRRSFLPVLGLLRLRAVSQPPLIRQPPAATFPPRGKAFCGHDRRYAIDSRKLRTALGWKQEVPFEEGIRATVRWYLDHPEWVERILSGEYRA